MSIKKRIILAGLSKVRKDEARLMSELEPKNFKKKYLSWEYAPDELNKIRSKLEKQLEQKQSVLRELRLYLEKEG